MDKYKLSSESQKNQNGIIIIFFFQTDLYKKIFFICELHSLYLILSLPSQLTPIFN